LGAAAVAATPALAGLAAAVAATLALAGLAAAVAATLALAGLATAWASMRSRTPAGRHGEGERHVWAGLALHIRREALT